jgi:hypothetical protein
MSEYETIELELDDDTYNYVEELARLAHVDIEVVIRVILAMEVYKKGGIDESISDQL